MPNPKYNNYNTEDPTFSPFTISGAFNIGWKPGSNTLLDLVIIYPFAKVRASSTQHNIRGFSLLIFMLRLMSH